MNWYDTRKWLLKPNFQQSFRIGNVVYVCKFKFFHWVLLKQVGLVMNYKGY